MSNHFSVYSKWFSTHCSLNAFTISYLTSPFGALQYLLLQFNLIHYYHSRFFFICIPNLSYVFHVHSMSSIISCDASNAHNISTIFVFLTCWKTLLTFHPNSLTFLVLFSFIAPVIALMTDFFIHLYLVLTSSVSFDSLHMYLSSSLSHYSLHYLTITCLRCISSDHHIRYAFERIVERLHSH